MIRQKIRTEIHAKALTLTQVAHASQVDKGNLSRFLKGRGTLSLRNVEKVLKQLSLVVERKPYDEEWLNRVDFWFDKLRASMRDMSADDLHLILLSYFRPPQHKRFLLKKRGSTYVF
jgi:transcriptional regulator with XRE-family HTH domain